MTTVNFQLPPTAQNTIAKVWPDLIKSEQFEASYVGHVFTGGEEQMNALADYIEKISNEETAAVARVNELEEEVEENESKIDDLEREVKDLKKEAKVDEKRIENLEQKIKELTEQLGEKA